MGFSRFHISSGEPLTPYTQFMGCPGPGTRISLWYPLIFYLNYSPEIALGIGLLIRNVRNSVILRPDIVLTLHCT